MKKKALLERLAALKNEHKAQLDRLTEAELGLTGEEKVTFQARQKQIDEAQAEIEGIEMLEAEAKRNVGLEVQNSASIRGGEDFTSKKPWNHFGEFLQAVAFAGRGKIDTRLAASGSASNVPSDGGFLVQEDFSTSLLTMAHDVGNLAKRCMSIPISGDANGVKLPIVNETSRATGSRWGGVRVYRMDEAAALTASRPKLDKIEISLEKLGALWYATDELLQDASALNAIASKAFSEEFAYVLDDEIYNGDGVAKCLGVMNSDCLVTVSKESGQAADTVVYENIVKMYARMPVANRRNAVWFINADVEPQLALMKIADSTLSFPVYLPPGGASAAPYGTLMGRPVVPIEQAATVGDLGDMMFGDFGEYLLASKGGLKSDSSMHVRFLYDEMTFRWTYRVNGQPAWKTAKTPAKGSNTLSPFVTLQARA